MTHVLYPKPSPKPTGSNGAGPSRLSLSDITRAFQQVPPPPAGSIAGKASPQSPAVFTTSGPARHPAYTSHAQPVHSTVGVGGPAYPAYPSYAQPVHSTVGGPTYPAYPSPMLSYSPAPTLLYPHPMAPNHMMGGSSPQYPQPMLIPMTHAAPGGQTPGPLRSLYPAHATQDGSSDVPAFWSDPPSGLVLPRSTDAPSYLSPPIGHTFWSLNPSATSSEHYRSPQAHKDGLSEPGVNETQSYRPAPAKVSYCDYGNCDMVFSNSELLARHIRSVSLALSSLHPSSLPDSLILSTQEAH
jgi:hypothetical protein